MYGKRQLRVIFDHNCTNTLRSLPCTPRNIVQGSKSAQCS